MQLSDLKLDQVILDALEPLVKNVLFTAKKDFISVSDDHLCLELIDKEEGKNGPCNPEDPTDDKVLNLRFYSRNSADEDWNYALKSIWFFTKIPCNTPLEMRLGCACTIFKETRQEIGPPPRDMNEHWGDKVESLCKKLANRSVQDFDLQDLKRAQVNHLLNQNLPSVGPDNITKNRL